MTESVWRPPVSLKVIAVVEIGSGAVMAGALLWEVAHGTKIGWPFQVLFEGIIAAAILAGVTLWKGEPPGFFASCILQVLQIVRFATRSFSFALMLGPCVSLLFPEGGTPNLWADLGATLDLSIAKDAPHGVHSFEVNLVPIVALIILVRAKAQSGQPWLRHREGRVPWDRGQWIGAYQIAAGILGVINAVSNPPRTTINLLFSAAVIGSGVALVRRTRFSDGIGVAINALQVPALGTTALSWLVRSGVSFVTAITWGPSGGIQFQFDVGSLINDPLALGVDGFVGINLTALALMVVLIDYRPNAPAPTSVQRRMFLTQR